MPAELIGYQEKHLSAAETIPQARGRHDRAVGSVLESQRERRAGAWVREDRLNSAGFSQRLATHLLTLEAAGRAAGSHSNTVSQENSSNALSLRPCNSILNGLKETHASPEFYIQQNYPSTMEAMWRRFEINKMKAGKRSCQQICSKINTTGSSSVDREMPGGAKLDPQKAIKMLTGKCVTSCKMWTFPLKFFERQMTNAKIITLSCGVSSHF